MAKIMERDTETKEFTDSLLTAFLDLRGFTVRPKLSGRMVSFIVSGNHLDEAIQEFYTNPKIPILNFCSSYKKVRSMIFNMRGAI
jgi:hypothetical protein